MELTLQSKSLVFAKNGVFKDYIRLLFWKNPIRNLKKTALVKGFIWIGAIGKWEDLKGKMRLFHSLTFRGYTRFGTKLRLIFRLNTNFSSTKPALN